MDLTQVKADVATALADNVKEGVDVQAVATDIANLVPNTTAGQISQAVVAAVTTAGLTAVFGVDAVVADLTAQGYTVTPPATTPPAPTA